MLVAGLSSTALLFCSDAPSPSAPDASVPAEASLLDTAGEASVEAGPCGTRKEGTLVDLNDPSSPKKASVGDAVHLANVVVTSPRVLIEKSNAAGTCTYGVFVADRATTFAPYSGILLTETVTPPANDAGKLYCTGTEPTSFPADLALGDVLDVAGSYHPRGPTTCSGPMPVPASAPRLDELCGIARVGKATPMLPADVLPLDIAGGSATQLKWANGIVRVQDVSAKADLDTFGRFTLTQSNLEINDAFYYPTWGSPTVVANQHFDAIVGVSFLSVCTWSLMPRTICELTPVPRPPGTQPACP